MHRLEEIIREIHRRSLWQVMGIYLAGSWVAVQVVREITLTLRLPAWFPPFAVGLLILGFPVVLATAFIQEGGPGADAADSSLLDPSGRAVRSEDGSSRGAVSTATRSALSLLTWRRAIAGGVVAFALWGAVAAGWLLFVGAPGAGESDSSPVRGDAKASVAVLPFTNMSPDEENAYFADGIHEDILTHLSKVRDLRVIARTSVLRYRDTEKSVREIGAELGVDAVLEGSVRRVDDEIRVVIQLIDPGTQGHLWAETFDRTLDDVFAVQTQIARSAADALEATLSEDEEERISKRPTESLAAYDLYLRGREAYQRYRDAQNEVAIRLFRRALELDPRFALAWAGLGNAFAQRAGRFGHPTSWADSAVRYARRAVDLGPDLAEAHKALGLALQSQGRFRSARDAYLETVRIDPNHYGAANNLGLISQNGGRLDEAIRWFRRSARLAPRNGLPRLNLAYGYMFLRLDSLSREWMHRALALDSGIVLGRALEAAHAVYSGETHAALSRAGEVTRAAPENPLAWTCAAGVAYMTREFDLAAEYARESLRLAPSSQFFYWHDVETLLGMALVNSGNEARGREVLREAMEEHRERIEEGDQDWNPRWDIATAHAALGERAEALNWLHRAYDAGFRMVRWPEVDPTFDELRGNLQFERFLDRLEGDVDRMRERVREQPDRASGG